MLALARSLVSRKVSSAEEKASRVKLSVSRKPTWIGLAAPALSCPKDILEPC